MNRILIVEDDAVVANIYSNKLRIEGYLVEVAPDGQAGQDKAVSFKPDLIVLDLSLPKVPGVEVIKFLRSKPEFKTLPIVVFSNLYLSGQVQDAWKAGATKCLSKVDCPPKQFIQIVQETLKATAPPPTPAPVPAAPAAPLSSTAASDEAFVAELRRGFLDRGPQTVANLRNLFLNFAKAENEAQRLGCLQDLARQVRQLFSTAGMVGFSQIARLSAALEALVREMYERPRNITPSTQRTVAQTVDFFTLLFEQGTSTDDKDLTVISTLVVDDEVISRRAVAHSLEKANLRSVSLDDPAVALRLLEENRFDLVILDVDMPGMSGFELCAKLRVLPQYANTPVIFVTSHTDFDSRAKSIMSGGNDLIAKPFVFMELAVKALTHILRSRFVKSPPPPRGDSMTCLIRRPAAPPERGSP